MHAIVIGGGPAGCLSAIGLTRAGWEVTLVERGPRARPKVCGHCLSPRGLAVLDRVGLRDAVAPLAAAVTDRLRLHLPGRVPLGIALDAGEPGLVIDRRVLDQALADRAAAEGVRVIRPVAARLVSIDGRARVEIGSAIDGADLVVGADGIRSAVARAAGLAGAGRHGRKYGFCAEARLPAAADLGRTTIEMFVVDGGYLGLVGDGSRFHLGALVGPGAASRSPEAFVELAARQFDVLRDLRAARFQAAGPMPSRPGAIARGPVALVGDAAGFVEPFTGEGLAWALEGAAQLAAVAARRGRRGWDAAAAAEYARAWRRTVGRAHRLTRGLAAVVERPALAGGLAAAAARTAVGRWLARRAVAA